MLRLCVACCGDDDVDDVLMAILTPLDGEDPDQTARPRAILAVLCLADEPNVSDETAQEVLRMFAQQVRERDGTGGIRTAVDSAAMELAASEWNKMLRLALTEEFRKREPFIRLEPGGLCGMIGETLVPDEDKKRRQWFEEQVTELNSGNDLEVIDAALTFMKMAYQNKIQLIPGMVEGLLPMLDKNGPSACAGAWALAWVAQAPPWAKYRDAKIWTPTQKEITKFIALVSNSSSDIEAVRWAIYILGDTKDPHAVGSLSARLEDENREVRTTALGALAKICEDETDRKLLSRGFDGKRSCPDPQDPIDEKRVAEAMRSLELSDAEIRRRYEKLAEKYKLKLTWKA